MKLTYVSAHIRCSGLRASERLLDNSARSRPGFRLLAAFGECLVTAQLVSIRLFGLPLIKVDFGVCHPLLA